VPKPLEDVTDEDQELMTPDEYQVGPGFSLFVYEYSGDPGSGGCWTLDDISQAYYEAALAALAA
jgi:hypothetical protein